MQCVSMAFFDHVSDIEDKTGQDDFHAEPFSASRGDGTAESI